MKKIVYWYILLKIIIFFFITIVSFVTRSIIISMNNFTNNSAIIEGGALKYISKRPTAININFYSANSAKYGNNIASYPIRLVLTSNFSFTDLYPTLDSDMISPLNFQLVDFDNQTVISVRGSVVCFNVSENNQSILKISFLQKCFPIISGIKKWYNWIDLKIY